MAKLEADVFATKKEVGCGTRIRFLAIVMIEIGREENGYTWNVVCFWAPTYQ